MPYGSSRTFFGGGTGLLFRACLVASQTVGMDPEGWCFLTTIDMVYNILWGAIYPNIDMTIDYNITDEKLKYDI